MSTPNQAPYYPPRPRSIFGPLVLITLGILFLLLTTGIVPSRTLGWWFVHYWPLLLILWGAVKMIEYMVARSRGEPAPRVGSGAIVFLVFFTLFGTTVTRTANWNWHGMLNDTGMDDSDFDFFNNRYSFTENFAQPLVGDAQIKVLGGLGDINVTASADAQAHVVVHKILRTDSQENADKLNNTTHAKFTQQGGIWLLDMTSGGFEHGRYDLDLQLPQKAPVSLTVRRGNLSVAQRDGNVDLSTDHGNVSAESVKGSASFHVRNGSITVKNVTGNVQVDGEVEDGNIADVDGTLEFNAGYNGDIELARIKQRLHFKSVRTDMQLAKLDGELNLGHGELRGSSVAGPFKLNTRSNEVRLEGVSGQIDIENRNGLVELKTKAPLGTIDINNVHGGIEIDLPGNAGFKLDAESHGGNIESEFNVNIDNSGKDATAHGAVGKGGPDVRLRADRGTIHIHKTE